ncbi:hypothetical protein ACS0TY_004238 [Phlomoides rotata]
MATLSTELRQIFGDDFDEHSLGEDDNPSNVFETGANEAQGLSNNVETQAQAQCPQSNHTENEANDSIPGMIFSSLDSLFVSYQEHARLKGFSVVQRTSKRAVEGDDYKYARMICDKSGSSRANKTSKRVGCTARLNTIRQDNGSWIILKMVTEHNHEIDPTFSPLMPAHRQLNVHMKRQLEANEIAGIRPCKNVRICEVQSSGPQNLGCLPRDCRNFVDQRRRLRLGDGDAEAIRQLFCRLQLKDGNFFYSMDLDQDGRLRNVLWIHPRCTAAYEEFHDVLSFDTTYLVNRYKMPFASIVGVNHHGHSILLGCALCPRRNLAIRDVMPNTTHRYCIWHILSKVTEKFKHVGNFDRCSVDFKGIVYDSLTIENFETRFVRRKGKWVPVYMHETFWAGMISTQRSEGMHTYFNKFVHSRSTLKQFMEQYDMAMGNKIQKEFIADFQSKNKVVKCVSTFCWEKQFQLTLFSSSFKNKSTA